MHFETFLCSMSQYSDWLQAAIAEVKNAWSFTSKPSCIFMVWCLSKHVSRFVLPFDIFYIKIPSCGLQECVMLCT
jgi:hypothetical protein